MDFGTMKTQIAKLLKDPDNTVISAADIGTAINDSIRFWKQKRFWFNEAVDSSVTISSATPTIGDMPTDILYPLQRGGIVLDYQDRRYELQKIRPEQYDAMNSEVLGRPKYYTIRGGGYEVYPYPDQAYTAVVRYIQDYSDLSLTTDTNDFTDNASWLIVYDATSRLIAERRQDERMESYYTARAENEHKNLLGRTNKMNATGEIAICG